MHSSVGTGTCMGRGRVHPRIGYKYPCIRVMHGYKYKYHKLFLALPDPVQARLGVRVPVPAAGTTCPYPPGTRGFFFALGFE
jgi:hypothetical protein